MRRACLSASDVMPVARSLASRSASAERLEASSRSSLPRSAAARPSAICCCRSAMAFCSGGQMNFIVIQMKMANQIIWPMRVALMLTLVSWLDGFQPIKSLVRRNERDERVGEQQEQRDTDADHGHRVEQTG